MPNGVEQPVSWLDRADQLLLVAGVALLAWWLLETSLGRKALADSRPRRNCMGFLLPFAVLFVWFLTTSLLMTLADALDRAMSRSQAVFLGSLLGGVGSLASGVLALVVARLTFARGIKGLGLRLRTAPRDFVRAFLTLLAVQPLVVATIRLTIWVMHLVNKSSQIPQHEALQIITESASLPLKILMVVLAVVVAPIVEEILFRGLFQTMVRSYLGRPWPAIAITSLLFAAVHANGTHWPALFVLALGLGYSYEKSGSLLRSMFMHALFNGTVIATTLLDAAPKG